MENSFSKIEYKQYVDQETFPAINDYAIDNEYLEVKERFSGFFNTFKKSILDYCIISFATLIGGISCVYNYYYGKSIGDRLKFSSGLNEFTTISAVIPVMALGIISTNKTFSAILDQIKKPNKTKDNCKNLLIGIISFFTGIFGSIPLVYANHKVFIANTSKTVTFIFDADMAFSKIVLYSWATNNLIKNYISYYFYKKTQVKPVIRFFHEFNQSIQYSNEHEIQTAYNFLLNNTITINDKLYRMIQLKDLKMNLISEKKSKEKSKAYHITQWVSEILGAIIGIISCYMLVPLAKDGYRQMKYFKKKPALTDGLSWLSAISIIPLMINVSSSCFQRSYSYIMEKFTRFEPSDASQEHQSSCGIRVFYFCIQVLLLFFTFTATLPRTEISLQNVDTNNKDFNLFITSCVIIAAASKDYWSLSALLEMILHCNDKKMKVKKLIDSVISNLNRMNSNELNVVIRILDEAKNNYINCQMPMFNTVSIPQQENHLFGDAREENEQENVLNLTNNLMP